MALVAILGLGACKATGGGQVGNPLESGVLAEYTGDANFGFNFTCEVETKRTVIRGQITYHDDPSKISVPLKGLVDFPEVRIHGTVEPIVFLGITDCGTAVEKLFDPDAPPVEAPPEFEGLPAVFFEGTYRSQDTTLSGVLPPGEFTVLVGDQGEPARPGGDFTGDLFAIDLYGGEYPFYTRGGYIEGGNIQVDNT